MSGSEECAEFSVLAPEVALGIAAGEERARALEHLVACSDCRRYLEELSSAADELLLLTPEEEPPIGFESRVLSGLRGSPRAKPRPAALVAAAAAAATVITVAIMSLAFHSDRELAASYRETLDEANGEYLAVEGLYAPGGALAGHLFAYEGSPSWVLIVVSAAPPAFDPGAYDVELVTKEGKWLRLGSLRLSEGKGSTGKAIPVSVEDLSEVRILGPEPRRTLEAEL
jgi:hypothetical protein